MRPVIRHAACAKLHGRPGRQEDGAGSGVFRIDDKSRCVAYVLIEAEGTRCTNIASSNYAGDGVP